MNSKAIRFLSVLFLGSLSLSLNACLSDPDDPNGGDPHGAQCPASVPARDSSCSSAGVQCQYGDDPCTATIAVCGDDGKWSHGGFLIACDPEPVPQPTPCPATPPASGSECTGEASCTYNPDEPCKTVFANCVDNKWQSGGYAIWCEPTPEPSCPETSPVDGSPCTGNLTCNYGRKDCATPVSCIDGKWFVARSLVACPEPDTTCPATPPTRDAACTGSLHCEYGKEDPCTAVIATCMEDKWALGGFLIDCSNKQN